MGRRAGSRLPEAPRSPRPGCGEGARKRTLTNLYNARPQWLTDVHEARDAAVAAAYAFSADISDDPVLRELMALNSGAK